MSKVLVIQNADFSNDKIDTISLIGGRRVVINENNTTNNKYLAVQSGSPVETNLNKWRTTDFVEIDGKALNGFTNNFKNSSITVGMVVFYDENKDYISYSIDMTKIIHKNGDIRSGEFHLDMPEDAKYIRMSWEYGANSYDYDYPIVFQL